MTDEVEPSAETPLKHLAPETEQETPSSIPEVTKPKVRLVVMRDYCTFAQGSDCRRCEHACPHGAITLPEEHGVPSVDHARCNGCGICFGVCDAFASTRTTLPDLHARIRRIALTGDRCYLTCRENIFPNFKPASNVVVLPCLSMLSPEFWCALLAEGIRLTVACDLKYCEDCSRGGSLGGEIFGRAIELAEEWTGNTVLFKYRIPEDKTLLDKYTDTSESSDRRAVFSEFASDMTQIASGKRRLKSSTVLQDFYERRERQRAAARLNFADSDKFSSFVPKGRVKRILFPKQRLILEAVNNMPEAAKRIEVGLSTTDASCCTQHHECVTHCPTGARTPNDDTGAVEIDPRLCIACGICVDICPKGACSIEDTTAEIYLQ